MYGRIFFTHRNLRLRLYTFFALLISFSAHAQNYHDEGVAAAQAAVQAKALCESRRQLAPAAYTGEVVLHSVYDNPSSGRVVAECTLNSGGVEFAGNYEFAHSCTDRNTTSNAKVGLAGNWPSCRGKCKVDLLASEVTTSNHSMSFPGQAPVMGVLSVGIFQYSGGICDVPTPISPEPRPDIPDIPSDPDEVCVQIGTLTQCLRTDGNICALINGTVTSHCWPSNQPPTVHNSPDGNLHVSNPEAPFTPTSSQNQVVNSTNTTNVTNGGSSSTNISIVNVTSPAGGGPGTCPEGQTGTPPNCTPAGSTCPSGQTGTPPNCTPSGTCPSGSTGTYPNCGTGPATNPNTVTGGVTCSAPPTCTGTDAIGCSLLLQTWRTRCDVANQAAQIGLQDTNEFISGAANPDDASELGLGADFSSLDSSGFGVRPACPVSVGFTIPLGTFELKKDWLCGIMDAIASLVLFLGFVHASLIIASGSKR